MITVQHMKSSLQIFKHVRGLACLKQLVVKRIASRVRTALFAIGLAISVESLILAVPWVQTMSFGIICFWKSLQR